jgi:hypothetical protein
MKRRVRSPSPNQIRRSSPFARLAKRLNTEVLTINTRSPKKAMYADNMSHLRYSPAVEQVDPNENALFTPRVTVSWWARSTFIPILPSI